MALLTRVCCLFIALLYIASATEAIAEENLQLQEQEIKAGLLYNFLKYTEWPPTSMEKFSSVSVCIFGDDPFEGYLQPMAGRTVNQRSIAIRKVNEIHETLTCQLLFVNANEKERWPQLRDSLKGKAVLTVSDFRDFVETGGMIEFARKDNHISVDLNMGAVTNAGLHMQDRLLKLVTVVNP
jgi:hypothetical protein